MARPLNDQVVVIVGASSGIGRLAALEFGKRGSSVVLAARNEPALREIADQIVLNGGNAHVHVTDVNEWEQVQNLAQEAVFVFGRIDTWVNVASVAEYATVDHTTVEEYERIIHTNLLGVIYGVKAVLPHMKRQGYGTLINIGSILSQAYVPFLSAYTAAKHGVKGFTDSLRLELAREQSGVKVTLIMPSSINTPFFNHARSKLGVKPRPIPPVYQPQPVADAILSAAQHPRREIVVGGAGEMLIMMERLSRALFDRSMLFGDWSAKAQISNQPDDGTDNVFDPVIGPGRVKGDFGHISFPSSLYTEALELEPHRKLLLAAAAAGLVAFLGARFTGMGKNVRHVLPAPRRKSNVAALLGMVTDIVHRPR